MPRMNDTILKLPYQDYPVPDASYLRMSMFDNKTEDCYQSMIDNLLSLAKLSLRFYHEVYGFPKISTVGFFEIFDSEGNYIGDSTIVEALITSICAYCEQENIDVAAHFDVHELTPKVIYRIREMIRMGQIGTLIVRGEIDEPTGAALETLKKTGVEIVTYQDLPLGVSGDPSNNQ